MRVDKARLKFYILVGLIIAIIFFSIYAHAQGYNFQVYDKLKYLQTNKFFPIIYMSFFIISSFFPLPFLTFFGAAIFPFHLVFIYSTIGNTISFILLFYLTRWLGRDFVKMYEEKHKKLKQLDLQLKEKAFVNVLLLRFFYLIPPEFINILGGLSKMRFRDYIFASILGTTPVLLASILFIQSYQLHNFKLFFLSGIFLLLLLMIPIYFIGELRGYFKQKKKSMIFCV